MLCQLAPTVVTSYPSIGANCHKKLQIKNPSNTKSNDNTDIIIVAFLENATIGYSLESLFVCVRPCLCVCVCFCTITQKEIDLGTRNRNTLLHMKIARTSSILSFIGSRSRSL